MGAFFFAIHFSIQNRDEVTLRYSIESHQWFEVTKVPLFLVILCSVFLGVSSGDRRPLWSIPTQRTLRQNQKIVKRLEQEIQSLRGPTSDQPSFLKKEG